MKIIVNGEVRSVPDSITVEELLQVQKVQMPEYVTVQVNEEFVSREEFSTKKLADGDRVDFLYFMGGGSRRSVPKEGSRL